MKQRPKKKKYTKSWFLEKINKMGKHLANLTKMRREKTQISKIRNERGEEKKTPTKHRELPGTTLRNYTQINWKV
jgi:hypothetical protein